MFKTLVKQQPEGNIRAMICGVYLSEYSIYSCTLFASSRTVLNTFLIMLTERLHIGCYKNVLLINTGPKCILDISAETVEVTHPDYCTL